MLRTTTASAGNAKVQKRENHDLKREKEVLRGAVAAWARAQKAHTAAESVVPPLDVVALKNLERQVEDAAIEMNAVLATSRSEIMRRPIEIN